MIGRTTFRILRALILIFIIGSTIQITAMIVAPAPAAAKPKCQTIFDSWQCFKAGNGLNLPSISDCKTPPTPQMPASGFSGSIDSGAPKPDMSLTWKSTPLDVYGTVEYPPPWSTYDLGCTGGIGDPGAVLDTTIGNWLKGVATSLVAICNSLHRLVAPPTFMSHLNILLSDGSAAIRDALFLPYIGLSLLLIGTWIIISARRKNLPKAVEMVIWALAVMVIAVALWDFPVKAGQSVDSIATSTIGNINSSIVGQPTNGDPASARASLLVENDLYKEWLQGELGSADSQTAKTYGARLLGDQTYTYAEAAIIAKDPSKAKDITGKKQVDFKAVAAKIQASDPSAYTHLKGQSGGGRIGAGFLSLIAALFTTPFMIVADVLIVVALFIIRMIVIFFPAIAVVGVFLAMRPFVLTVFGRGVAAVTNAVVFAVGAGINTLAVGLLLDASLGLPRWVSLFLSGVVTFLLWHMLRPFRKLNSMASPKSIIRNASLDSSKITKHHKIKEFSKYRARHRELATLDHISDQLEGQDPTAGAKVIIMNVPEAWSRPTAGTNTTDETMTPAAEWTPTTAPVGMPDESKDQDIHVHVNTPQEIPALPAAEDGEDETAEKVPEEDVEILPRAPLPVDKPKPDEPIYIEPVYRGDQVMSDQGDAVWRIWDPKTQSYEIINNEDEESA